jgi:SAM-dependent methyltransferase
MNPRRIRTAAERDEIRRQLLGFYSRRSASYGLADRPQEEYEDYATLLQEYGRAGGRVLDFGCGTGRSPETIARRVFGEVIGCDLAFGERQDNPPAAGDDATWRLVRLEGMALPFPAEHFDVVASLCVLEHLIDVEEHLAEAHRVLKPGGVFVLVGPNWSGLNNPLKALYVTLVKRTRYWLYETAADAAAGIIRSFFWYCEALCSQAPRFLLIAPRMSDGVIAYEAADDDCVHLCQPLSFKRWLEGRGYVLLRYNRGAGRSPLARVFNAVAPSLATTNVIVARKPLTSPDRRW